jgi:hypothetical protein
MTFGYLSLLSKQCCDLVEKPTIGWQGRFPLPAGPQAAQHHSGQHAGPPPGTAFAPAPRFVSTPGIPEWVAGGNAPAVRCTSAHVAECPRAPDILARVPRLRQRPPVSGNRRRFRSVDARRVNRRTVMGSWRRVPCDIRGLAVDPTLSQCQRHDRPGILANGTHRCSSFAARRP